MEGAQKAPSNHPERTEMAKQTFKKEAGKSRINLAGDAEPAAVVGEGETVTTDNEELKTALRQAGFSVVKSSGGSSSSSSSSKKKDDD
jgi:hypothetical protein